MKKSILISAWVLATTCIIDAQETVKKELAKKGDLTEATIYHDNGIVAQQGHYDAEGRLHGTWNSYDTEGNKTAVARYDKGEKTGTWFFFDEDLLREAVYENNRLMHVTTWSEKETEIVGNY